MKHKPDEELDERAGEILRVIEQLNDMSSEERYVIFSMYCLYCGAKIDDCKCGKGGSVSN